MLQVAGTIFVLNLRDKRVRAIPTQRVYRLSNVGMHHAKKSWKQVNPLSNTIKDTSTILCNPFPELCREGNA